MQTIIISKYNGRLLLQDGLMVLEDISKSVPLGNVEAVLIYGNPIISTRLTKYLLKRQVNTYFFSTHGTYLGQTQTDINSNYERQVMQYSASLNADLMLKLGKNIIQAKQINQASLLKSYDRQEVLLETDFERMDERFSKMIFATGISELMGYEGIAARDYFALMNYIVPREFKFNGRSKHPPLDAMNAMLSFGYSLLYRHIYGHLLKYGLNPGIGIMHKNRRNHATLVSDLIEEWRAILVDDLVLDLISSQTITAELFTSSETKGIHMNDQAKRDFLTAFDERIFEKNSYVIGDNFKYSFLYALDKQIESYIKVIETQDAEHYRPVRDVYGI